ncbi:MAG: glycosyltransferase family 2 protein [Endomicrobia bacterium]|nr:glycosyltransferase family 2 protein [Endomicrobiia bacterium]
MELLNIFAKIIFIANGIIIFFFFQIIVYGIFSYIYYFRQKKKFHLTLEKLENIASTLNKELPVITILIPAKNERDIIGTTIDRFLSLNYPKEKLNLLIILDEKEVLTTPFEETTHYVVYQKQNHYNKLYGREIIIVTSVPVGFDGEYKGKILPTPVKSTKPRALNWGLNFIPSSTQILGFYDADAFPERDTLLYVAYKYITKSSNSNLLLQGPVVQVRNYLHLEPFNKIYAVAQAITHEWYLPALLLYLPFIGGTNFFIEYHLLLKVKGFNKNALSEDLELGCRLFVETNTWPEFMPYITTEQTPPTYKAFFHQRTRWASGYIQVLKEILIKKTYFKKKFLISFMLIFYGILPWFAAQILTITTIGMLILSFSGLSHFFEFLPSYTKIFLFVMNIGYILFLLYYFNYAVKKIYIIDNGEKKYKFILEYLTFLLMPIAAALGTLPYTYGFLISFFTNNIEWKKTIRTKE